MIHGGGWRLAAVKLVASSLSPKTRGLFPTFKQESFVFRVAEDSASGCGSQIGCPRASRTSKLIEFLVFLILEGDR